MMGGDETKRWAQFTIWLLAIALLLPTGKVSAEVATIQPKTTGITPGALKELILEMANDAGDEQHLMPLRYCPPFSEAARRHARDMIEGGYFEHIDRNDLTVTGLLREAGVRYFRVAENLAGEAAYPPPTKHS